jgi:ATP-dependent helicase/nuclease subunit B
LTTFLAKTAQHLIQTYDNSLSDCCVVLPNKRAGLFLKQELSKLIDKPIWLPPIMGAEELIEKLSNTQVIDNLTQLFELYEVYQQVTPNPETFEEFSKWGQILLHDFNEIDRYLIPTESFFTTMNNVRAIEVWNLGDGELTTIQQNYLAFWKQMGMLYHAFHEHLLKNNNAYQGKAFRIVAEQLRDNPTTFIEKEIKWKQLIFVGFNALTLAEETIITKLKEHGKAEILWDADEYYLNNEIQESGLFLRAFKQKSIFTPFHWVSDKFKTEKKQINVIGIPQNIGQAKYLSTIFKQLKSQNQYKDTAVVLAEESILVPVLESIPAEISSINVTMGYPIKNAPLSNFFEIYFNMLLNANRFGKGKQLTYHYKDISKLLQLPISQIIFGEQCIREVLQHIVKHNWVFINKEKLAYINDKLPFKLHEIFDINTTLDQSLAFIEAGKTYFTRNESSAISSKMEMEYLFHFSKLFNQLKLLNASYPVMDGIKTFVTIYRQLLSNLSIELYGEPLQGLQVMGMLETRNIDFKNVVMLSINEGILPAGKTFNSFIPFDVKREREFNLPTHIEKDAVYAYHFYRLVQNAENIYILYNTETNEFGSGEKSRFVTQLENELALFPNIDINHKIVTYPTLTDKPIVNKIVKSEKVISKLNEFFQTGVSPSALNAYMNCPLDFYNKYVLRINEVDEVEETVESSTFGTVIHDVLEELYKPFAENNLLVTSHDIKKMKGEVEELTKAAFVRQQFSERELQSGKNLITLKMALNYVDNFLTQEIKLLENTKTELYIKLLEKQLGVDVSVNGNKVFLKGKADRIDVCNNQLRIVDYKTGSVDEKDLKIESVAEVLEKPKAFQVLFYAYLYAKEHQLVNEVLTSGIVSLKKPSNGFMPLLINKNETITSSILAEFELLLLQLLTEIATPELVFEHDDEASYCLYCS